MSNTTDPESHQNKPAPKPLNQPVAEEMNLSNISFPISVERTSHRDHDPLIGGKVENNDLILPSSKLILPNSATPAGNHIEPGQSGISMGNEWFQSAASRIDGDHGRFKEIVRGKIRKDLGKYISSGELIGKQGDELVSIPVPQIDVPHFKFGDKGNGGAGQGKGNVGDPLGKSQEDGDGAGKAGDAAGNHILEVEITLDELAQMLGDRLALPRIQPRGKGNIKEEKHKYTGIRPTGPESLRHNKRTFKEALKRQIASGEYDPDNPIVVPIREDKLYRAQKNILVPEFQAAVLYLMDVSGSMTDDQKEIVRIESFWIDTWIRSQYKGVTTRYIIHDAVAREVDQHTFFHTRESGGTRISSAYNLAKKMMFEDHPFSEWNVYVLHFSDGDNWGEDNRGCMKMLREEILPNCNLFCYGQVDSPYGSGEFYRELKDEFGRDKKISNVALSEIKGRSGIEGSIKTFFEKGM